MDARIQQVFVKARKGVIMVKLFVQDHKWRFPFESPAGWV